MNVAIDIDGTASAYPEHIALLTAALKASGYGVVLLTGHSTPDPAIVDRNALLEGRRNQVAPWGLLFDEIIICVGTNSNQVAQQKADYCRSNNIALFIDDSEDYCVAVRKASPQTLVLRVCK